MSEGNFLKPLCREAETTARNRSANTDSTKTHKVDEEIRSSKHYQKEFDPKVHPKHTGRYLHSHRSSSCTLALDRLLGSLFRVQCSKLTRTTLIQISNHGNCRTGNSSQIIFRYIRGFKLRSVYVFSLACFHLYAYHWNRAYCLIISVIAIMSISKQALPL